MTAASGFREELEFVAFRLDGSSSYLARGMDSAYASHRERVSKNQGGCCDCYLEIRTLRYGVRGQ